MHTTRLTLKVHLKYTLLVLKTIGVRLTSYCVIKKKKKEEISPRLAESCLYSYHRSASQYRRAKRIYGGAEPAAASCDRYGCLAMRSQNILIKVETPWWQVINVI
ncbi:hypothetical protein PUN28_009259 [Cardiocondyla obscurior]|uniref:Uncharacterized protein n=1 Tax=Cardiocondyla obscurior TaxID=286306 RepID=A0AAW2FX02_9HYME